MDLNNQDYVIGQIVDQSNFVSDAPAATTDEAATTTGQVPAWNGSSYVPALVDGDAGGITVVFDSGTQKLIISLPQPLTTTSDVAFAGLTIGAGGTRLTFTKLLSFTIDFGAVGAGGVLDSVQTFNGADPADSIVSVMAPHGVMTGTALHFTVWVSAADQITIRAVNPTAAPIDPPSGDFLVELRKY